MGNLFHALFSAAICVVCFYLGRQGRLLTAIVLAVVLATLGVQIDRLMDDGKSPTQTTSSKLVRYEPR